MQFTKDIQQDYFRFIYERQMIWYKRFVLKQPAPWTNDEILQKYKFINMYRELDRCTKYAVQNIGPLETRKAQLFNTIFFRFFNADQLYENLGIKPFTEYDKNVALDVAKRFEDMKKRGLTMFNTAYVISPGPTEQPKHITILTNLIKVWTDLDNTIERIDTCKTPEESFAILCEVPLAGPFLACEFWTDLTYYDFFKQKWTDDDFVNIGPGAEWGLEIMFGKLSPSDYKKKLQHLHTMQREILPTIHKLVGNDLTWEEISFKEAQSNKPYLSITDIEGALCEFRKYWNISHGQGRRRYFKTESKQTQLV